MNYPTNLVTAIVTCKLIINNNKPVTFATVCGEFHEKTKNEGAKGSLAGTLAYQLKDTRQALYKNLSIEEVYAELMSEKYEWKFFTNPI